MEEVRSEAFIKCMRRLIKRRNLFIFLVSV